MGTNRIAGSRAARAQEADTVFGVLEERLVDVGQIELDQPEVSAS